MSEAKSNNLKEIKKLMNDLFRKHENELNEFKKTLNGTLFCFYY